MKPFHYKIIQRNNIYITAPASSGGPFSRTDGFGQRLKLFKVTFCKMPCEMNRSKTARLSIKIDCLQKSIS